MKVITFILKLLFLVYSLKWFGRFCKANNDYVRRGGKDAANDMPGAGSLFMAFICALPTLAIVGYILKALEIIQVQ